MADVHDKKTRSYNMSKIKGKNTKPEIIVRKFLHANGFRFRLHVKTLPGKPDIVLRKYNTIIDVRGCFWHGHKDCKWAAEVKSDSEVKGRITSAIDRDKENIKKWKKQGWNVIIIWDSCQLNPKRKVFKKRDQTLNKILRQLNKTGIAKV